MLEANERMRKAVLILVVVILGVAVWTFGSHSGSISVCTKTGMLRHLNSHGPFHSQRIEETPLSRVLIETGFRKSNEHEWLYAHGGGSDLFILRYTASGAALSMPGTVRSPKVAAAVRLLITYTDKATVEKWLQRIFDPDVSPRVSFYTGGLAERTNRQDFLQELTDSEATFQEMETPRKR